MEATKPLFEAIALRRRVQATYNRTRFDLAPHILYTRHGELYLDAIALERDGRPPKERKLGAFKISGLSDVSVAAHPFEPDALYSPDEPRYDGTTIFAL